ncbi:MAG: NAD(P)H-binding protein [Anaerolineales bacterium]|jgi:putative NADH-flavin reductase
MKLTIFGASGATGRQLMQQALAAGNQVVAYVRSPARIPSSQTGLTVIQGELTDPIALGCAIHGADVVISLLGPRPGEDLHNQPLAHGMQAILSAMYANGVRRLIISSTPSVTDPNDLPDLQFKLLVAIIKTTIRPAYEEIVAVVREVRTSDLDWTIVRVSMLSNLAGTGSIRAGYLGMRQVGTKRTRADLARFMLAQVQDVTWLRKAPAISN